MKTIFAYTLTAEQFGAAMQYRNRHLLKPSTAHRFMRFAAFVAWVAMGVALFAAQESGGSEVIRISLYTMAAGLALYYLLYSRAMRAIYRAGNHLVGVPTELKVADDGLYHSNRSCRSVIPWSGLRIIDEIDVVVLLGLDPLHFLPMPISAFDSAQEKNDFIAYLKEKSAAASADTLPNADLPPLVSLSAANGEVPQIEAAERHWNALLANLFNALKLAFGRQVAAEKLTISWWQATAFAIFGILPPLIYDFAVNGIAGEVAWENIPNALFHLPIFLLAGVATAYALGRGERTLWIFQILLMIALIVDVAYYSTYSVPLGWRARGWLRASGAYPFIFSLMWLVVAASKATLERVSVPLHRRLWAGIALSLLIIYPLTAISRERDLWLPVSSTEDEDAEDPASYARLDEDTLYQQREMLERELAAVTPGHPGVIDVFFIGVAGYGSQNVFMREVKAVGELFRQRFDAAGKTVLLINNRRNPRAAPLASVTSLRAALARVAALMNKDEDLLFLFLTSHGSEDHRFSLDLGAVKFHELDPTRLRQLLDESGIKYRVVVVSACYSGGFVDALRNDNTLVITASAADKNSFGCSNEAEWTYFGKAYFDEALRQTFSFSKAFELARPIIAEREREEKFTPSEPQMALGRAIESKLARLENQLDAKTTGTH